jgi:hypothetical protein
MKVEPAECADHRRYERERLVIVATFRRRRRVPIDHVNWVRMPRKTRGQRFVQFGDNAGAQARKLLRDI